LIQLIDDLNNDSALLIVFDVSNVAVVIGEVVDGLEAAVGEGDEVLTLGSGS
jgi:hypothetical protein